jgi:hypothetical protein
VYNGYTSTANWTDITLGTCGNNGGAKAKKGWDFCTGVGVPNGYAGKYGRVRKTLLFLKKKKQKDYCFGDPRPVVVHWPGFLLLGRIGWRTLPDDAETRLAPARAVRADGRGCRAGAGLYGRAAWAARVPGGRYA